MSAKDFAVIVYEKGGESFILPKTPDGLYSAKEAQRVANEKAKEAWVDSCAVVKHQMTIRHT